MLVEKQLITFVYAECQQIVIFIQLLLQLAYIIHTCCFQSSMKAFLAIQCCTTGKSIFLLSTDKSFYVVKAILRDMSI